MSAPAPQLSVATRLLPRATSPFPAASVLRGAPCLPSAPTGQRSTASAVNTISPQNIPLNSPTKLSSTARAASDWEDTLAAADLRPLPYAPAQQAKMRQLQAEVEALWQSLQHLTQSHKKD